MCIYQKSREWQCMKKFDYKDKGLFHSVGEVWQFHLNIFQRTWCVAWFKRLIRPDFIENRKHFLFSYMKSSLRHQQGFVDKLLSHHNMSHKKSLKNRLPGSYICHKDGNKKCATASRSSLKSSERIFFLSFFKDFVLLSLQRNDAETKRGAFFCIQFPHCKEDTTHTIR